jgi:hypothetical protein
VIARAAPTGARYLVEGSVQRAGERVRITAKLSDATSGHQLWGQRHEQRLRDVFALQDEITEAIVAAIEPELWASESERAAAAGPAHNLDVWQAVQRGWWHLARGTVDDDTRAIGLCAHAVALDPLLARGLYALAASSHSEATLAWALRGTPPATSDGATPLAALANAAAHARSRQRARMREAIEHAVRLDPSSALAYRWLGLLLAAAGPIAVPALTRIRDLAVALAHFRRGRFELAAVAPADDGTPEWMLGFAVRVASRAHHGRVREARALLAASVERRRELGLEGLAPLLAAGEPDVLEAIRAGLRLAGFEE